MLQNGCCTGYVELLLRRVVVVRGPIKLTVKVLIIKAVMEVVIDIK